MYRVNKKCKMKLIISEYIFGIIYTKRSVQTNIVQYVKATHERVTAAISDPPLYGDPRRRWCPFACFYSRTERGG